MDNVEELVLEEFSEMIIDEFEKKFGVRVKDTNGSDFTFHIDKIKESNKFTDIIRNYMNTFKLNGITNSFPLDVDDDKYAVIYSQDGKNKLCLKVYDRRFKVLFGMVMDKYLDDRSNYFGNEEISYLEIENSVDTSGYEKVDDCVRLILKTDENGNVLDFEKNFLSEMLLYKFSQIGEKATIMVMTNKDNLVSNYIIYCGNMVVNCPKNNNYSCISDIINKYNESLNKGRKK